MGERKINYPSEIHIYQHRENNCPTIKYKKLFIQVALMLPMPKKFWSVFLSIFFTFEPNTWRSFNRGPETRLHCSNYY